ncbi:MAG TPA: hypothetical protein VH062_08655 [Polyangiaceae bacterium]|nr:hypothetical protein [Polyangiaceae bacterium]
MKNPTAPLVFAVTSLLVACGSPDATTPTKLPTKTHQDTPSAAPEACSKVSGFAGDELCIAPPDPSEGIQLHVGPADYDDADAMAPYIIAPGDENVKCYLAKIPEAGFYYFNQKNRMRSGSHHMLINLIPDTGQAEGPTDQCDAIGTLGTIPGSQTPSRDFPDKELAPEDGGLARYLPEGAMASIQLHYVNTGTDPNLREAWVNVYRKDEATVTDRLQSVFMVGDLATNIAPHSDFVTTEEYAPPMTDPVRIFGLTAHSHAHSQSFTVWREHDGQEDMVYQSFNWSEPDSMIYNTVVTNPTPDAVLKRDGGTSGTLMLNPGDKLKWSCDVNNDLDTAIHFANAAHTAEMCLLGGFYVSDDPSLIAGVCVNGSCSSGVPAGVASNIDGR